MLKRSIMTLYSGPLDIYSHQVRIVLAEKGVAVDIVSVDASHPCEDLADLNPYNSLPTLVDRELILYNANVIMEYLDERFPHPPLLPVYPVARAKSRLVIWRILRDWYRQVSIIYRGSGDEVKTARNDLCNALLTVLPVFSNSPYFLSEDFTLVDCVITPLLWRLPDLGVKLPRTAKIIEKYEERAYRRDAFQASLTDLERELRE